VLQRARSIYSRFPWHDRRFSHPFLNIKHKIIDVPTIRTRIVPSSPDNWQIIFWPSFLIALYIYHIYSRRYKWHKSLTQANSHHLKSFWRQIPCR
jgi:hypothetical protein